MNQRYTRVPWFNTDRWNEAADLTPVGDPEVVQFLYACTLLGLFVKDVGLEGVGDHVMLGIKEDPHGRPVSCAITNELSIDMFSRVPAQSNQRRLMDECDGA